MWLGPKSLAEVLNFLKQWCFAGVVGRYVWVGLGMVGTHQFFPVSLLWEQFIFSACSGGSQQEVRENLFKVRGEKNVSQLAPEILPPFLFFKNGHQAKSFSMDGGQGVDNKGIKIFHHLYPKISLYTHFNSSAAEMFASLLSGKMLPPTLSARIKQHSMAHSRPWFAFNYA